MKTKFFVTEKSGKIEFTKAELLELLNEVYDEGYMDGVSSWHLNKRDSCDIYWRPYLDAINTTATTSTSSVFPGQMSYMEEDKNERSK